MRAFQLCFASHQEDSNPMRFLVPELLPEFEPEMSEAWEDAPLSLRYRYDVLPPGILPRFIVRTHALSDDAPHWRHGVVLAHSDAKALVRVEADRSEVQMFVLGPDPDTRLILAAILRRELELLNKEIKAQPIEEMKLSSVAERWIGVRALFEVEQADRPVQRLPALVAYGSSGRGSTVVFARAGPLCAGGRLCVYSYARVLSLSSPGPLTPPESTESASEVQVGAPQL